MAGPCVQLKRVFLEFAQFGTRNAAKSMDVYRFTKLCRECDLLPQPQDTPSINLIFYKVRFHRLLHASFSRGDAGGSPVAHRIESCNPPSPCGEDCIYRICDGTDYSLPVAYEQMCAQGANSCVCVQCKGTKTSKLTFGQFKMALKVIAEYLHCDLSAVHARIARSDGPLVNNITLPRYVKQHDTVAGGHSPTASQRAAMTNSFLGGMGGSPSAFGATPRSAKTPKGSMMGGSTMMEGTPTSAVRRARTQGASEFDRRSSTTPVGAWR